MPTFLEDLKSRFKVARDKRQQKNEREGKHLIAKLPSMLQKAADAGESGCVVYATEEFDGLSSDPIARAISDWAYSHGLKTRQDIMDEDRNYPVIVYGWR